MLLHEFLPSFDVSEKHHIIVRASQAETFAALRATDLADSSIARALLFLRALPATLSRGRGGVRALRAERSRAVTLETFEAQGFKILSEHPPEEIVIGLEGKFWLPTGAICTPAAEAFRTAAPAPGTARAVWNFKVTPLPDGACELTTETRVLCADAPTRRRFLPYWALIRIGSGVIRRAMLSAIKRHAEARR